MMLRGCPIHVLNRTLPLDSDYAVGVGLEKVTDFANSRVRPEPDGWKCDLLIR